MPLDALNAAAAAVVLQDADPGTRTEGVVVAALCPGVLGLAVPLVLAQQGGLGQGGGGGGGGGGPQLVAVPDVTAAANGDAADATLKGDGFVPNRVPVFSNEIAQGTIISQDPPAKAIARLGSTVTYRISQGQVPPEDAPIDAKAVKADLDAQMKTVNDKLDQILNKFQQQQH
jgi:hypothetical protein